MRDGLLLNLLLLLLVLEFNLHAWPFLHPKERLGLLVEGVNHVDGGDLAELAGFQPQRAVLVEVLVLLVLLHVLQANLAPALLCAPLEEALLRCI